MGKVRDNEFWESARYNNASFMQYYNRLTELSVSMFDWKNLPDTIDVRFMELALFGDGQAVFFYDEELGFLCLRVALNGGFDVYRVPIRRRAYASNGYNRQLDISNSVIIWNNYLRTNSMLDVELFAKRLSNIDRMIDVNINAQKTPILITCDEDERMTMKNVYLKYDGNQPVIFGKKSLKTDEIKVLTTGAPYVADKAYTLKTQLWNEALTYLGISNINVTKKERMITDEVQRNQGSIIASRNSRLGMRQQACEEINRMFDLNIWCEFKEDIRMIEEEIGEAEERGNEERGEEE